LPELPEVETYGRYITRHALHQKIARVRVLDERILGEVRPDAFVRKLKGATFTQVRRHGKHLFVLATLRLRSGRARGPSTALRAGPQPFDSAQGRPATHLRLHFGMTGDVTYSRSDVPRFARVVFDFENGAHLAFEDMRLFGVVDLVDDPDAFIRERKLGPDPLDRALTPKRFAALLEGRRGAIKALLMTQEIVAGLGNLYVDETLYQTGIHPRRAADRLSEREIRAVYDTIRRILRETIARHAREAELPRSYLIHHRQEGERCPRCGGTIRRTVVFGRTTYFCGKHQR
jgi:formamidopyrimidine-DNA glycosylase